MRRALILSLMGLLACASFRSERTRDADAGPSASDAGDVEVLGDGGADAGKPKQDGGNVKDTGGPSDGASGTDARADAVAASDATSDAPSTGLDPDVVPASPLGAACTLIRSETECSLASVCRFVTATTGRCESCSNCGNLNALCTASDQCDILFQCFRGHCANFCQLGTTECGPPADCIDVGNPTIGMCKPF